MGEKIYITLINQIYKKRRVFVAMRSFFARQIIIQSTPRMYVLLVLSLLSLAMAGCRTKTPEILLPFQEIEVSSFTREAFDQQPESDFYIIASEDEIAPPGSGLSFRQGTLERLAQVDFSSSLVAVYLVGQLPGNGIVDEVIRNGDTVTIWLKSYSIGPGNYALKEHTAAYRYVLVSKQGVWDCDIEFLLKVKTEGKDWGRQTSHYIP